MQSGEQMMCRPTHPRVPVLNQRQGSYCVLNRVRRKTVFLKVGGGPPGGRRVKSGGAGLGFAQHNHDYEKNEMNVKSDLHNTNDQNRREER